MRVYSIGQQSQKATQLLLKGQGYIKATQKLIWKHLLTKVLRLKIQKFHQGLMEQKSKLTKFLTMLKGAQNTAFVHLICDNIKLELQQKPWKAIKIVDFLMKEVPKASSDFTRLHLADGLIQLLSEFQTPEFVESCLQHYSTEKQKEKLTSSLIMIDASSDEKERAYFTFADLLKSNKNFFSDLLQIYSPLLAELNLGEPQQQQASSSKDSIKQMFMEGALGAKVKTDKLMLSDFIDESFFEDVDMVDETPQTKNSNMKKNQQNNQTYRKDLIKMMKAQSSEVFMQISHKRQKTAAMSKISAKQIMMSPVLSLVMQVLINESLIDSDWKVRQNAANTVRVALKSVKCLYYIIGENSEGKFEVIEERQIAIQEIAKALVPYQFIVMMKDHFNDFEDLKVITPVRDEALNLLVDLIQIQPVEDMISQLPNLLKTIDQVSSDNWITRFNFFMILKALILSGDTLKKQIYHTFNRVLIESLLNLEDEVKIFVTDLINMILPLYLEAEGFEKQISYLLKNLQKNLRNSDEIESSAISIFALITRIIDSVADLKKLSIKFDLKTYCPFNFHQILNVRFSYLQILNKCLTNAAKTAFIEEDFRVLIRLTLQSLAMERSKPLVQLNLSNLEILIRNLGPEKSAEYLNHMFTYEQSLPTLIYSYHITTFEAFLFFESQNFETIQGDYYKIVFRPVSPEEIQTAYYGKLKNMTKALSSIINNGGQMAMQHLLGLMQGYMMPPQTMQQGLQTPIHDSHLIYLMTIYNLLQQGQLDTLDIEHIASVSQSFLTITEDQISLYHFQELPRLQQLLQLLYDNLVKSNQANLVTALQPLFGLFDACYIEHKLANLAQIQAQVDTVLAGLFADQPPQINDCFCEIRTLIGSLVEYASTLCIRLKQVSALIHLSLVQANKTQMIPQLNNLIKPILNQLKKEQVKFIQSIAAKGCVRLIRVLMGQGKVKAAQQVMTILVKDMESIGQDTIQDRGIERVIKTIAKDEGNIINAFDNWIGSYLAQVIKPDQSQQFANVLNFLLKIIFENQASSTQLYQTQTSVLVNHFKTLLDPMIPSISQLPSIALYLFKLFPLTHTPLLTHLVHSMHPLKLRSGFDTLTTLLDDLQKAQSNQQSSTAHPFLEYISVFVIPVIQSIQYSTQIYAGDTKQVTLILAQLLSLLPLNLASLQKYQSSKEESKSESAMGEELQEMARKGYQFLQVFVNNRAEGEEQTYKMSIKVKANLRDYQRQGINWMASLGQYNLNCALCDDMGLGKTLQALCVVLNESFLRGNNLPKSQPKPLNLIVCPTSITYNWRNEIRKYFDGIRVAIYEGSAQEKTKIIKGTQDYDVIIISYEKLRNEIKQFQQLPFFYLVLDEAHLIKNAKAKLSQAVKSLQTEKKLVLTGTPLQNKVSELWSIFDFLMPGFLEEESVFNKKYNQYLAGNIKRLSEKLEETQAFVEALKSLKKRIAPFILRRTKDQVLKELPPKIIQDVVCKMTSFQEYVHGLVEKNFPINSLISTQTQQDAQQKNQGKQVLQNLIMHRKICNHPMFVAEEFRDKDKNILTHLTKKSKEEVYSYDQSGKLLGLYDKLVECDIITAEEAKTVATTEDISLGDMAAMSLQNVKARPHRALIFCQFGSFLRMIVDQVLKPFKVPYMELLSQHSPKERVEIVDHFNSDETIKVLILTTAVGGLGLTLTGADTVIFAEHDWNPMRDLQAIDRAHRIGQTRQVCVYRLIMQDTLEEKIMNLQRFKENLARSLVQSKDASVEATSQMELTDLLQSFQEHSAFVQNEQAMHQKKPNSYQDRMISNIEDIWQGGKFSTDDL